MTLGKVAALVTRLDGDYLFARFCGPKSRR